MHSAQVFSKIQRKKNLTAVTIHMLKRLIKSYHEPQKDSTRTDIRCPRGRK